MARRAKKPRTWAQVAVLNAGFRDALRAFEFAIDWGLAAAMLGRQPETVEEYAEVAEVSRATAFRNQQAFRKAFPSLEGPAELNELTGQQKRYDEFMAAAKDLGAARRDLLADVFSVGAQPATQ